MNELTTPRALLLFYCLQENKEAVEHLLESFYCVFEEEAIEELIDNVLYTLDEKEERPALYLLSSILEEADKEVNPLVMYTQEDVIHLLLDQGLPYKLEHGVLYLNEEAERFLIEHEIYI